VPSYPLCSASHSELPILIDPINPINPIASINPIDRCRSPAENSLFLLL